MNEVPQVFVATISYFAVPKVFHLKFDLGLSTVNYFAEQYNDSQLDQISYNWLYFFGVDCIHLKHNYLINLYKSLNYPKIITMEEAYKLVEEMIKLKQTIHQRVIIKVSHFRFSICDSFRYLGRLILCSGQ